MEFSSAVYGAIALSFLFYYLLSAKSKKAPPHAGGARLITGHLNLIHGGGPTAGNLATLADKHGPAFTIQLGVRRTLVVSSPLLAKQIFTTNHKTAPFQTKLAKHLGPEPDISGPGAHDDELRKLISSACVSEVGRLVNGLYNEPGRVRADVGPRVRDLGLSVVMMAVAGKRLGGGDGEEERWRRVVGELFRLAGAAAVVVGDAFPHFGWLDVGGYEKSMKETSAEMGEIIGGWLVEHRRRKEYSGGDVPRDFMDVMLAAAVEDGKLYGQRDVDTIISATCKSLITGVSNTTSIMLLRTLSLLLNNPDVMKRAQEELEKHVGRERRVIESDINNLVYLEAIIKEALRLHPPTPLCGPHEFTKSCDVGGYHVPKGTWLIVNLWKLQLDPEAWREDPTEFRPERFLNMHENLDQDYALIIPFGAGRRVCDETEFCVQVLRLVLANMLQAFELSRVSDEQVDMCVVDGVMNYKDIPLDVLVAPRLSPNLYS